MSSFELIMTIWLILSFNIMCYFVIGFVSWLCDFKKKWWYFILWIPPFSIVIFLSFFTFYLPAFSVYRIVKYFKLKR